MERSDIEIIVHSVITHYGIAAEISRIALFGSDWKLEMNSPTGKRTILLPNSSPQQVRMKVMSALGIEG